MEFGEVRPLMFVKVRSWDSLVREFGVRKTGTVDCPYGLHLAEQHRCGTTAHVAAIRHPDAFQLLFTGDTEPDLLGSYHPSVFEPVEWADLDVKDTPKKPHLSLVK